MLVPPPPELPSASMQTPKFSLRWMLHGVVDQQLRPAPYVAVELHGVTTAVMPHVRQRSLPVIRSHHLHARQV
jgi:hypothetical protein